MTTSPSSSATPTLRPGELSCASNYKEAAVRLTPEQLRKSTSELFAAVLDKDANPNDLEHHTGKYAHLRTRLDYSYHRVPNKQRQILQDSIIDAVIRQQTDFPRECRDCIAPEDDRAHPQVLFTAGAMASGKGHTLRHFLQTGGVTLPKDFIWIDPDALGRKFPERQQYIDFDRDEAPEKLHPEAAMLQEILGLVGRERRQSAVIDGSLSDGAWFKKLMAEYRQEGYSLEIFFVFADIDVMVRRAKEREKETGRQTDKKYIERTARKAPESVQCLATREHVDRVRIIDNSSDDKPPKIVYDSKGDERFEVEGKRVDVMKWVKKGLQAMEVARAKL